MGVKGGEGGGGTWRSPLILVYFGNSFGKFSIILM